MQCNLHQSIYNKTISIADIEFQHIELGALQSASIPWTIRNTANRSPLTQMHWSHIYLPHPRPTCNRNVQPSHQQTHTAIARIIFALLRISVRRARVQRNCNTGPHTSKKRTPINNSHSRRRVYFAKQQRIPWWNTKHDSSNEPIAKIYGQSQLARTPRPHSYAIFVRSTITCCEPSSVRRQHPKTGRRSDSILMLCEDFIKDTNLSRFSIMYVRVFTGQHLISWTRDYLIVLRAAHAANTVYLTECLELHCNQI